MAKKTTKKTWNEGAYPCIKCYGTKVFSGKTSDGNDIGCCYCGGKGSKAMGTGISTYSDFMKNEVFNEFIAPDEALNKIAKKTGNTRDDEVCNLKYYINCLVYHGYLCFKKGKLIDAAKRPGKRAKKVTE